MNVTPRRKVLVAVSGGIDSVVLLNQLVREGEDELLVAHVDHGIRADSSDDAEFVRKLAESYELAFHSTALHLGVGASELTARQARYEWLEHTKQKVGADTIATAHHEDDVIETAVLNLLRGTGWRGIASLRSTADRMRPLLATSKAEIVGYALEHGLEWREDSTNDDLRYTRNFIRHGIVPRLNSSVRRELLALIHDQWVVREAIESELKKLTHPELRRYDLVMSPSAVSQEVLRQWVPTPLERGRLLDLLVFAKTAYPGAKWSLDAERFVLATREALIVSSPRD